MPTNKIKDKISKKSDEFTKKADEIAKKVQKKIDTAVSKGKKYVQKKNAEIKERKRPKNGVQKSVQYVGDHPFTVIKTGIVVGSLYLVYKVVNKASARGNPDAIVKGSERVDVPAGSASISDDQARVFAANLLGAMDRWGTDESTILSVFQQLKYPSDFKLIYNAFGIRAYNGVGAATGTDRLMGTYNNLNLIGWLKAELSPTRDKEVYDYVKRIIEASGLIM